MERHSPFTVMAWSNWVRTVSWGEEKEFPEVDLFYLVDVNCMRDSSGFGVDREGVVFEGDGSSLVPVEQVEEGCSFG